MFVSFLEYLNFRRNWLWSSHWTFVSGYVIVTILTKLCFLNPPNCIFKIFFQVLSPSSIICLKNRFLLCITTFLTTGWLNQFNPFMIWTISNWPLWKDPEFIANSNLNISFWKVRICFKKCTKSPWPTYANFITVIFQKHLAYVIIFWLIPSLLRFFWLRGHSTTTWTRRA